MTSHSISYLESLKSAFYSTVLDVIHVVKVVVVDSFYYIYGFMTNQSSTGELRSFYCGKVILITGASSGIGEALVKTLSSIPGTILIISSRRIENLIEVADSCRVSMPNAKILPVELDLEKYDDMESYMSRVLAVLKENGLPSRIDVLINNAGISSRGAAMNTSLTTLERVMAINFYGPVALTTVVASQMITNGGGAIGVVSSVQGKLGVPWRTAYAASKHALQGYFDAFRSEMAVKDISVTTISPGYVKTSLSMNALNADGTKYNRMDETTAGGMEPDNVAVSILLSIARKEVDIVLADAKTCAAIQMKAILPDIVAIIMKKRAKS